MFDMRCRTEGLAGGGARKAIEKSVVLLGEDGVTIMAGNGLFSSTSGRVRSIKCSEVSGHEFALTALT